MLSDVRGNNLSMLRIGVCEDVLNKVVAILVTGDINERDTWTICTALADSVQVTIQEFDTTNLETLLYDL